MITEERFWSNVSKSNGCWLWTGYIHPRYGYGMFNRGHGTRRAHRIAWEYTHGPIVDGLHVLHHCDNPPCVNVEKCLFLGTPADNNQDMWEKGRGFVPVAQSGEAHFNAKLTIDDVQLIRGLYAQGDHTQVELAAQFGITQVQISSIVRRESWASV